MIENELKEYYLDLETNAKCKKSIQTFDTN